MNETKTATALARTECGRDTTTWQLKGPFMQICPLKNYQASSKAQKWGEALPFVTTSSQTLWLSLSVAFPSTPPYFPYCELFFSSMGKRHPALCWFCDGGGGQSLAFRIFTIDWLESWGWSSVLSSLTSLTWNLGLFLIRFVKVYHMVGYVFDISLFRARGWGVS